MPAQQQYTPNQVLEALVACQGSRIHAAEYLQCGLRTISKNVQVLKARGIDVPRNTRSTRYDHADIEAAHEAAPDGHMVKGVSTLYDEDGNVKQRWIKTDTDAQERFDNLRDAVEALIERVPYVPSIDPPLLLGNEKLLNLYTITDYHMGMLAWRREGGDDWDLTIAKATLVKTFEDLIRRSPHAAVGLLNQLGDFVHFDGMAAVTPTSGHPLDADSRFQKIVEVVIDVLCIVIEMMLHKYPHVHVIMAEGNHDIASSVWLRVLFKRLFANNPRVTVDDSALPYYAYQHGKTLLAFHHGHLTKKEKLGAKVPALFAKMWGDTEFRFVHTGHLHSEYVKEENGIITEMHPTMASRDAYAARGAWFSSRGSKVITYHRDAGEMGRTSTNPDMLNL